MLEDGNDQLREQQSPINRWGFTRGNLYNPATVYNLLRWLCTTLSSRPSPAPPQNTLFIKDAIRREF